MTCRTSTASACGSQPGTVTRVSTPTSRRLSGPRMSAPGWTVGARARRGCALGRWVSTVPATGGRRVVTPRSPRPPRRRSAAPRPPPRAIKSTGLRPRSRCQSACAVFPVPVTPEMMTEVRDGAIRYRPVMMRACGTTWSSSAPASAAASPRCAWWRRVTRCSCWRPGGGSPTTSFRRRPGGCAASSGRPGCGCFGIQRITPAAPGGARRAGGDKVLVLSGAGVGGGSLVYANTLYEPLPDFYDDPQWHGIADWRAELAPHYDQAQADARRHDVPADDRRGPRDARGGRPDGRRATPSTRPRSASTSAGRARRSTTRTSAGPGRPAPAACTAAPA